MTEKQAMSQEGDAERLCNVRKMHHGRYPYDCDACFLVQQLDARDAALASANAMRDTWKREHDIVVQQRDAARAEIGQLHAFLQRIVDGDFGKGGPGYDLMFQLRAAARVILTALQPDAGAKGEDEIIDWVPLNNERHLPIYKSQLNKAPSPSPEAAPPSASDDVEPFIQEARRLGAVIQGDGLIPQITIIEGRLRTILRAARQAGERAGREQMREEAATCALEQRCERGTPWNLACTTIAEHIRRLAPDTET